MTAALGRFAGRLVFAAWLVLVWILLWGGFTLANLVGGIVVAVVLLLVVPRPAADADPDVGSDADRLRVRPLAAVGLGLWFVGKLVAANVTVAYEALRPPSTSRIRTAIVAVPLPDCPPALVALIGNIITLTPGTLTMEIDEDPTVLYVHELTFTTSAAVQADVYAIERRVVAAFGSDRSRAASAARVVDAPEPEVAP